MARQVSYQTALFGNFVQLNISIENSFRTSIDFNLGGQPYSIVITAWQSRGFKKYAELFHKSNTRDISKFGAVVEKHSKNYQLEFLEDAIDEINYLDGRIIYGLNEKPMTLNQKLNILEKAAKDIMNCINLIGQTHQRSIIDHCIWYRENHTDTYESAITKLASDCVV